MNLPCDEITTRCIYRAINLPRDEFTAMNLPCDEITTRCIYRAINLPRDEFTAMNLPNPLKARSMIMPKQMFAVTSMHMIDDTIRQKQLGRAQREKSMLHFQKTL